MLAIYRSVGVEVLKLSEWPERPDDVTRFEALLSLLATHGAEKAHVIAVKQETGARRYRPAEVAGAPSCAPPCGYAGSERGPWELLAARRASDRPPACPTVRSGGRRAGYWAGNAVGSS